MVGHGRADDQDQDDHCLQADHVVLQHRPGSLRYLDGLGVSQPEDQVDADVGGDEDDEGDEDSGVGKDTDKLRAMASPLQSSEEGD